METIYHRACGEKVVVYAANDWDIRTRKIPGTDGYELSRWYNPYRTRLGGLHCGSLTVETRDDVNEIIKRFADGLTIDALPVKFPDFAIVPQQEYFVKYVNTRHRRNYV